MDMAVTSKSILCLNVNHRYLRLLKEREKVPKDAVAWFLSDRTKTAATIPQDVDHDAIKIGLENGKGEMLVEKISTSESRDFVIPNRRGSVARRV